MSEFSRQCILQFVAGRVPSPLQGKEILARLVFRLDEEQARLAGLQVCALIRAHRPFVSEPVAVDPGSGRIWILTPKLVRDLHMIPAHSPEEALEKAKALVGKPDYTVTVIPDGIAVMVVDD